MPLLYQTLVCEERRVGEPMWTTNLALYTGCFAKTTRALVRHLLVVPLGSSGLGALSGALQDSGMFSSGLRQVSVVAGVSAASGADDSVHIFYTQLLPRVLFPSAVGDEFMHSDLRALSPENAPCISMRLLACDIALTDLNIRCAFPNALTLVSRSSASLGSLRLCDIAPVLAWDVMAMLGSPGSFAGLKALALEFSDTSTSPNTAVAESGPIALPGVLPLLKSLSIRHCPFDVRLCLAAIVPKLTKRVNRLASLEIHGSRADVLMLAESRGLSAARSVVLACVGMARPAVDRAERFVSSVFTGPSFAAVESLSLTVIASRPVACISSDAITCARLYTLELRVPLRLGVAESLLLQLPYLRRLCLPYIATEAAFLSPHVSGGKGRVLSRSLQLLSMGFWDCRQDLRALSYAVLCFVADIPSLLTLVHDTHVAGAVRRLIDGNSIDHLRNLVITDHTKLSF
ncbi:hypothetical protein GGI19_002795 [Coemansia pectinata]|uniref:Uncharacterized protein n=1 Tax=Coemansia pectinata TaxID=1052879 RepID=A0A9W8GV21_9FUNG|nr:hypothetical protein GGI19_002795 [Coemansia pectinata]